MTLGTLFLININESCKTSRECDEAVKKLGLPSLIFDAASAITLLVVGILGAVGVIGMPPAAAYAMISIGGAFVVFDLGTIVLARITGQCSS